MPVPELGTYVHILCYRVSALQPVCDHIKAMREQRLVTKTDKAVWVTHSDRASSRFEDGPGSYRHPKLSATTTLTSYAHLLT